MSTTWTSQPPTVEGWWWWRCGPEDDKPLCLCVIDDGNDVGDFEEDGELVSQLGGQWAGPIPMPEEATT